MIVELLKVAYAISIGFVAAGILASTYQLMTLKPPSFVVSLETWGSVAMSVFLCAFAGPFIVMRNAIRGRQVEGRPVKWFAISAVITAVWSFCSGLVMIDLALSLSA